MGQEFRRAQHAQLVHAAQFLGPQQMRLSDWGHDQWGMGLAEARFLTCMVPEQGWGGGGLEDQGHLQVCLPMVCPRGLTSPQPGGSG